MIDFTNMPKRNKTYAGANGSKISVLYNNEVYMLKFPPYAKRNKDMSYSNGCISEYLGSHIYEIAKIPVQQTFLGTYKIDDKEKVVVACKDFTSPETVLQDFASLKNTVINSEHNGYGTELSEIEEAINNQLAVDPHEVSNRFWDMFIVDAFIGNWDRHNGNWGFLYNMRTDTMSLAPVYDCGSCLYPQTDDKIMQNVLNDKKERDFRIYEIPLSAIYENGKKIRYYDYISSLKNKKCNLALKRITPRLDMQKINKLIDDTPCISDLQKSFYKTMLKERKEKILDKSLKRLKARECEIEF